MIVFNKPSITDLERRYISEALDTGKLCGDGSFTKRASAMLSDITKTPNVLLTTSCSHALEMSCRLIGAGSGDEIIVPSYNFVSAANAIMLAGASPVFCDIEPDTYNIDASKIEELITERTKAIFVMDYAGVPCDMDKIDAIAKKHGLHVLEDAAQALGSFYKGRPAGTLAEAGAFSFHETKNYVMGEGGALVLRDEDLFERAEILREKGTDRSRFFKGMVDKYTWREVGSSYLPSDILAALLTAQLERFDEIMEKRMHIWQSYRDAFLPYEQKGLLHIPHIPDYAEHNAHMFYLVMPNEGRRAAVIDGLKERGILSVFHYIPLHTSPVGVSLGYREGMLPITEEYSARLLRLPLFADLGEEELEYIIKSVRELI